MDDDRRYWFAPRRYGRGTGLPTTWQGWALFGALIFLVLAVTVARVAQILPHWMGILLIVGATIAFAIIAARRMPGGLGL